MIDHQVEIKSITASEGIVYGIGNNQKIYLWDTLLEGWVISSKIKRSSRGNNY